MDSSHRDNPAADADLQMLHISHEACKEEASHDQPGHKGDHRGRKEEQGNTDQSFNLQEA